MIALDEPLLEELANALGVSPDFVKSFKNENVIYSIQNNGNIFNDNAVDHPTGYRNQSQNIQEAV
ncbi:hypothetical protein PQ465_04895 [Sphingobacterium oryzagri]|uniref:Uncharacterized protein n=1 Tax=Sphingobacterium oryzagri TaxID=3025669 RepID=A0ABY7WQZ5_9SPHI|nr:hypothetical protein [Sphingobacterium sp. KACC 22765]WDF69719.1 hypothetical protein PQ465_04895 [Sphingobacterium sp. KACC 22765]